MRELKEIFAFGWPYLKRYKARLIAGILLGVFFGLSHASFIWATKTLFERLGARPARIVVATNTVLKVAISTNIQPEVVPSAENELQIKVGADSDLTLVVPEELKPEDPNQSDISKKIKGITKGFAARLKKTGAAVDQFMDQWLPLRGRDPDWKQMAGGLLLIPILVFIRGYIGYLSSYCMAWVSERVIRDLRLDLLEKLNTLSMNYFNKSTIGELMMRVRGDTDALYRCLSIGFSDLIKEPITILALVTTLFLVNWKLTLLAIIFTPITIIPIRILGKKVRDTITKSINMGTSQDSLLIEVYTNIRVVKAFSLEPQQMTRFRNIFAQLLSIQMRSVRARELVNPIVEVIATLGLGVVIIFIFKQGIAAPSLVGFLTGVTLLFEPIKKLGRLHVHFQQAGVGANRLVEFFREEPSVKEKPDAAPLTSFNSELRLENVTFGYKQRPVLREMTLSVPRGIKLGVAGESGSGKSTLVNLIFRFYDPTNGRLTIDGRDLRDVPVRDLRQQMALVSQEVVIFDQTVVENIACGREGATRADVEAAARAASAHEFIMQLPKGYDTRLGEAGKTLSGGQRQRIAIARAFVRNAPILILDEATAQLDPKAEGEVQAAIDRLAENRTVICIAHRLSTLARMDRIIVLNQQGKIMEDGTFTELLKANKIFAQMARKQGIEGTSLQK